MNAFLFEQYGYYPKSFVNNVFIQDDWIFKLIEVQSDDKYIKEIDEYSEKIRSNFENKGPFIIKTRFNKLSSFCDNKQYILVCVYRCNMSLKDLNKFHYLFREEDRKLNLKQLLNTWNERMSYIEKEAVSCLRVDSVYYKNNVEKTMFCLGLTQNAIQYLSDVIMDYGNEIKGLTITHRRLKDLNSFDFFNPLNFIVDHPLRDLVDLYKNDFLQFDALVDLLEYYDIEQKLASIFIARLMYPGEIFDALEENIYKKGVSFRLEYNIEKESQKIKKIYLYFKDRFKVRPIDWLED